MHTRWSRIRAMFLGRALDARLDEEVQAHLDELTAEYERRGLPRRTRAGSRHGARSAASSR